MNTEFVNWKLIGKGAFAIVYLAEEKYSHVKYAIKVIPIKKMNQQELRLFNNEKSILRTTTYYNFKHIVKLVNVIKDPTNYLLVLEYCNGGSLHDSLYKYINKYGKPFPEDLVKYLMKQIITGIKCLHNVGVIHRDLKLANILLKYNNNIDKDNLNLFAAEIRITDFNVSYIPNNSEPKTVLGTVPNMAPSVINNALGVEEKPYDKKIDIWSLGTICYEMLFGKSLFGNGPNIEIAKNIFYANFNIPNTISPQARSFLYCMLQKEGYNRFSCEQLLNHEFITRNNLNNPSFNNLNTNNNNFLQKIGIDYNAAPIIDNNGKLTNIIFKDSRGYTTVVITSENTTIKDLIRLYFYKIKRPDYINNKKINFYFNIHNLKNYMYKTINEMKMNNCSIEVYYSNF